MPEALTLDAITNDVAAENIMTHVRERRLTQGQWHGRRGGDDGVGVEIACLLGSIHPSIDSPSDCPARLMPEWLARLTVRLFDGVPEERIFHYGEAYAQRLHRWSVFDAAAWERVRRTFITRVFTGAIDEAQAKLGDHTPDFWPELKGLSDQLLTLLLDPSTHWKAYVPIRDQARVLRDQAWSNYYAARRRRAEAAAVAAEAAAVAVAVAVAAEAEAAEAVAVAVVAVAEAVAAAAEAVAAAEVAVAEAAAEVARRTSYARSFDLLLEVIDAELAA